MAEPLREREPSTSERVDRELHRRPLRRSSFGNSTSEELHRRPLRRKLQTLSLLPEKTAIRTMSGVSGLGEGPPPRRAWSALPGGKQIWSGETQTREMGGAPREKDRETALSVAVAGRTRCCPLLGGPAAVAWETRCPLLGEPAAGSRAPSDQTKEDPFFRTKSYNDTGQFIVRQEILSPPKFAAVIPPWFLRGQRDVTFAAVIPPWTTRTTSMAFWFSDFRSIVRKFSFSKTV